MQTIMSSFADPRHQRDDWPVLRWVAATPAAGAWRRLPRCLCSCPWEPDWRIKQDHREGRPFNDWCGWRNTVWVGTPMAEKVFLQTLNMTNRWKKTSEDVQAISAPKVIPQIFNILSCSKMSACISTWTFPQDISCFLSCITIPDFVPITKHNFLPPPMKDQGNVSISN